MHLHRQVQAGRTILTRLGFFAWAAFLVTVVASLMVGHWLTLPKPDVQNEALRRELNALRTPTEKSSWIAVHVLYTECRCSQRIFEHLFSDKRPALLPEKILLVGNSPSLEKRARRAGFEVIVLSPSELRTRLAIEAAPLLLVLAPTGEVAYAGGYTERKQGPEIQDLAIVRGLIGDRPRAELPLYGCGVSKQLQQTLDPLGIKY